MYSLTNSSLIRKRRRRRLVRKMITIFVIIFTFIAIARFINTLTYIPGELISAKGSSVLSFNFFPTQENNSLKEAVENSLSETEGSYAVFIKNLKTGEGYSRDEHKVFEPGSLYKLWIMATVYRQIQGGVLDKDAKLSESVESLNNKFKISSDSAELKDGTINFTVASALNQMITISHNYAALILTSKIRLSTVASFLKQNGFNESKVGTNGASPSTTAYDIALFLEKLYMGEIAHGSYSQEMINLLKNQRLNHKLPKNLPEGTVIAHKTGEIGYYTHDAGIVYTPKGDYIIVVLSDTKNPAGAEDKIADVSKAVYDYFMR